VKAERPPTVTRRRRSTLSIRCSPRRGRSSRSGARGPCSSPSRRSSC
jgi:hypothetical protein